MLRYWHSQGFIRDTVPVINRKLSCVLMSHLTVFPSAAMSQGLPLMTSFAFLQGNISPAICQRPLFCAAVSHSPPLLGREAYEDSGVRPECCLSHDTEAPGEKWHSICFPSWYLDGHVWLTYCCQVTRDIFSDWARLSSHSTRSCWLAKGLVNFFFFSSWQGLHLSWSYGII